jgi:hypothetical protein
LSLSLKFRRTRPKGLAVHFQRPASKRQRALILASQIEDFRLGWRAFEFFDALIQAAKLEDDFQRERFRLHDVGVHFGEIGLELRHGRISPAHIGVHLGDFHCALFVALLDFSAHLAKHFQCEVFRFIGHASRIVRRSCARKSETLVGAAAVRLVAGCAKPTPHAQAV